jgi:DNA polymerase
MRRALELAKLFKKIKKCERCSDLVKSRYQATTGYGNAKVPVVFVGLAPTERGHNVSGIPFTSIDGSLIPSGKVFISALKSLGYNPEDIYFTELVKCHPPKNRKPTQKEIMNCESYLLKEIAILKPKVIVPLGRDVANYFTKRGWKNKIFTILHPSYVYRFQKYTEYSEQFARLGELIKKELK